MKNKNKKLIIGGIVILALVLAGGFVYAAVTGTLFFTGDVTLQGRGPGTVQLQFHSVEENVTNSQGSHATSTLESFDGLANQRIVIDATFVNTEGFLEIPFTLENTGDRPVRVVKETWTSSHSSNPDYRLRPVTTLHNAENVLIVIEPGDIYETVVVGSSSMPLAASLQVDGPESAPEDDVTFTFELKLEYEEWTGSN